MSIPKILHYIWIGGNPEPELLQKCKQSWEKFCPDYKIKKWDESNLDVNINNYTKQAYEQKKYAFVSDYLRLKILYEEGGIYLDVDVELLKSLDEFLNNEAFMGFEKGNETLINPGLVCGCEKGNKYILEIMNSYEKDIFDPNNLVTICNRTTDLLKNYGLKLEDKTQNLDGLIVYSSEYFCPYSFDNAIRKITNNTVSIHHYNASWMKHPKLQKLKYRLLRLIGKKNTERLKKIFRKNKK